MKKFLIILPLAIVVTAVVTLLGTVYVMERPAFADNVEQKTLMSSVLDEEREYLVHLPTSYAVNPEQRYPVIYVLDGSSQDIHTAYSAALLARIGMMPEVIVVGIPNVSGEGRQRDYTPPDMRRDTDPSITTMGGGDAFLAFLREELIPRIERDYRAGSKRMLAGHSRGGLLVVYALTAEPELFETYIANSPALWRDEHHIVSQLRDFLAANHGLENTLFLSLGSDENDKMRAAYDETVDLLTASAPDGLAWRAYTSVGAGHGENPYHATPVALHWLYMSAHPQTGESTATITP